MKFGGKACADVHYFALIQASMRPPMKFGGKPSVYKEDEDPDQTRFNEAADEVRRKGALGELVIITSAGLQ